MKIVYSATARDDIMWFRKYYNHIFRAGRENARNHLKRVMGLIAENPHVGHPVESNIDVLEFPITRTPFTVLYRMKPGVIEILRVYDQRSEFSNDRSVSE